MVREVGRELGGGEDRDVAVRALEADGLADDVRVADWVDAMGGEEDGPEQGAAEGVGGGRVAEG